MAYRCKSLSSLPVWKLPKASQLVSSNKQFVAAGSCRSAKTYLTYFHKFSSLAPGRVLATRDEQCRIYHSSTALISPVRCNSSYGKYTYDEAFQLARDKPDEFWAEAADGVHWFKKWSQVLDNANPPFTRWFVGGEMNTCFNCVDRHVEAGNGDVAAIVYDSPVTNTQQRISYKQLLTDVSKFAGALSNCGVQKGDRVLIYMPMIPQAIVATLACARIGAIHSIVFGGFAAKELSTRIAHAEPKVVVSANCGIEVNRSVPYKPMLDKAIELSNHKPQKCIIFNRPKLDPAELNPSVDLCYEEQMAAASPVDCVPVSATDPVYLLYTSGTTGLPKAVVRPSGGHAVVLNWSMYNIYGVKPKEVWWAASDLGWVVGHSYIIYAPLLHGNTTVLYEGKPVGTPDPGAFFRVLADHNVASMFTAPTALRAIRREDPEATFAKKYNFDNFRALFVAGEHCDHETMEWAKGILQRPILDNWWQTETGWPITSTHVGLGNTLDPPHGVAGKPVPGWDVKVLDSNMEETDHYDLGSIVVRLPLPPGSLSTLWRSDERFSETYFQRVPGYYDTMDAGYRDEFGNIAVMSRADDVINVAGHRLSSGQIEEAMLELDDLAEVAVIGLNDSLKGQVPMGLCVVKSGVTKSDHQVVDGVIQKVREVIGPVASFKVAIVVPKLPKTRSGKVARNTLHSMANGQPYRIPVTIEDASVYDPIAQAMEDIGLTPGHALS